MPIMGHVASAGCAGRPTGRRLLDEGKEGRRLPREGAAAAISQRESARAAAAARRMAAEPGQSKIHDVENTAALNGLRQIGPWVRGLYTARRQPLIVTEDPVDASSQVKINDQNTSAPNVAPASRSGQPPSEACPPFGVSVAILFLY